MTVLRAQLLTSLEPQSCPDLPHLLAQLFDVALEALNIGLWGLWGLGGLGPGRLFGRVCGVLVGGHFGWSLGGRGVGVQR